MPDIKMKIGESRRDAEIKLLEVMENHGWRRLDVLGILDTEAQTGAKYDLAYIDGETKKPEIMDLSDIDELMDKLEQGNGYLSLTDKATAETHMIAVKKVDDLYVIADAPAGENMEEKIFEAMQAEASGELGFFESIIEALKEFIDNVINGLEVLRNRMPEDAYTRYNAPHESYMRDFRGLEKDDQLNFAQFNSAMAKVFKDGGKFTDNPFGAGMAIGSDEKISYKKASDFVIKHADKGDIFRLDLNSPEASTIVNVVEYVYMKEFGRDKEFNISSEFMDIIHNIQTLHEVKAKAEVTRGELANVTSKEFANMDATKKEAFEKNIVKIVKAELATEFLAVLPAAGKDVVERSKKMDGMMDVLNSVDDCQPLKDAIKDAMKPNLKETLKALSEKIKHKDFLKAIQKDMQMKNDGNKKETTFQRENSIAKSKGEHTL